MIEGYKVHPFQHFFFQHQIEKNTDDGSLYNADATGGPAVFLQLMLNVIGLLMMWSHRGVTSNQHQGYNKTVKDLRGLKQTDLYNVCTHTSKNCCVSV